MGLREKLEEARCQRKAEEEARGDAQEQLWIRLREEAERLILEADANGQRTVVVHTVDAWQRNAIDLTGCAADELGDDEATVEAARAAIRSRGVSDLRGAPAKLCSFLKDEGVRTSLRHRVAGGPIRRTAYNVWDIVASW